MSRALRGQCQHGISDDTVMTFRHVVEDFITGTRATVIGYWCPEHGSHGTTRVVDQTRKVDLTEKVGP